MRSQVILIDAIVVFLFVVIVLILTPPLFSGVADYVEAVRRMDEEQVSRLLG